MSIAAVGMLATPVQALARLVAASSTFQELIGDGIDYAAALESVFYEEADDSESDASQVEQPVERSPKPRAIIYLADDWSTETKGPGEWKDSGYCDLAFEFPIPEENRASSTTGSLQDEAMYALNTIGQIIADIQDNSGLSDADDNPYLNATRIQFLMKPFPCDPTQEFGYFWGCELRVFYP